MSNNQFLFGFQEVNTRWKSDEKTTILHTVYGGRGRLPLSEVSTPILNKSNSLLFKVRRRTMNIVTGFGARGLGYQGVVTS